MINIAKEYLSYGLSVLPIKKDSKSPAVPTWKELQIERMSEDTAERVFEAGRGIGIIGGSVSGNLEIIDFDNHLNNAEQLFNEFMPIIDTFGLPYEKTISGGYHVFYRCVDEVSGNKKLANMYDATSRTPVAVIETRGEKGYVVCSPTKGYTLISGSFSDIPILTSEEREYILKECLKYNEVNEKEYEPVGKKVVISNSEGRPGDEYNASIDALPECIAILKRHGWESDPTNRYFRRPHKEDRGWSATLGKVKSRAGVPLFYVFSSNAFPFEAEHCYSPFAVFAYLEFGGDFSLAAQDISGRYVRKESQNRTEQEFKLPKIVETELMEPEYDSRNQIIEFMEENKPKKKPVLTICENLFSSLYDFRLDVISHTLEWKEKNSRVWSECDENSLYRLAQNMGVKVGVEAIKTLLGSDFVPKYNPFESYFESIHAWDGIDYFNKFAQYLTIRGDKAFFIRMLEKQFVRTIKCALEPEYYNRFAFIFQSREQEIGKSRLINFLNPFGTDYFTDEQIKDEKDSLIALTENFIYNLEEIDDMKKLGVGKLKAILAKKTVKQRLPYQRQKSKLFRCCSFFGSTNLTEFLTDDVNTRWLIFTVDKINWDIFHEINIHDLWAQAYALYRKPDFDEDLTPLEKQKREENNLYYRQSILEEDLIANNFDMDSNSRMALSDVAKRLTELGKGMRMNTDLTYIQDILINLGFEMDVMSLGGRKIKVFKISQRKVSRSQSDL